MKQHFLITNPIKSWKMVDNSTNHFSVIYQTCTTQTETMTLTWTNHLSGYTQALHRKQKTMTNFVNYFSSWSRRWQYKEYSDSLINHFPAWPQTLKRKQNEITSSPIIHLADHELYNTNRKHWQSHGSSTSPTAPEHCNTNTNNDKLVLLGIIWQIYYKVSRAWQSGHVIKYLI